MCGSSNLEQRRMVRFVIGVWVLAFALIAAGCGFNPYVNLSNNPGGSYFPSMAVDSANTIHVVWSDNSINYPGNYEILYRRSSDGGVNWSAISNLSNSPTPSHTPMIAAAGPNQVAVAWIEGGVVRARVRNGGDWLSPTLLSTSGEPKQRLSVAINEDGVVLVAWCEGNNIELYGSGGPPPEGYLYRRWNGTTWSDLKQGGRIVTMRGTLAAMVTPDRRLLFSSDAGRTWGYAVNLPPSYIVPDDMKIDGQHRLHLAWLGPEDNAVYAGMFSGSPRPGFIGPTMVSSGGGPNPYHRLSLAVNGHDQARLSWSINTMVPDNAYTGAIKRTLQLLTSGSSNGISWSDPDDVANSGCYSAIAASQIDARFYWVWESPDCFSGSSPEVIFFPPQAGTPVPEVPAPATHPKFTPWPAP